MEQGSAALESTRAATPVAVSPLTDQTVLQGQGQARYRLDQELGRGGMGVVYRAMQLDSGRPVALKTVAVLEAAFLPRIRREIHALSRLDHPGIVKILDHGIHEGLPWYAMELVEGRTLRQHQLGSTASPETDRLTLVRRLCPILAYLHGQGLVHRDLKPDNILVRPDGRPVLVDFGLAAAGSQSRETLVVEASAAGTLAYMAPEQLRGQPADARTDLYALGCLLFELLTGCLPFTGPSPQQVFEGHLHRRPPAPSQLRPDLRAAGLDELVLQLLAKRPEDRPGHADVVATALEALGAEAENPSPDRRNPAYLYRPGFAGREPAIQVLRASLMGLEQGTGGLLLIGGESGIGKTRLLLELASDAVRRGIEVLAGEGTDGSRGPLEPLRKPMQAVADRCRAGGTEETARLLGRRARVLGMYQSALADLPGNSPETVQPLPPQAARQRLFADLGETLGALATQNSKARPGLLLILDDLQWADELTIGWLESLLRQGDAGLLGRAPVQIVCAYRSEEVAASGRGPLQGLLDHPRAARLELGRFEEAIVGAIVGDMLALATPPPRFVRFLTLQSEGNPFFVAELLRTAVDEGLLDRDGQGRWQITEPTDREAVEADFWGLPLPRSLRQLVTRRLEGLPQEALRLVEATAVLGREAEPALAACVAGLDQPALDEALTELLRRQVLETNESNLLRFAHDKIREAALDRLSARRRKELHRAAARTIEARDGHSGARLAALAQHWEGAGAKVRARTYFLRAARAAAGRFAHEEAERLYQGYLRLARDFTPESIAVRNELGESMLALHQRHEEATAQHRQALEESRQIGHKPLEAESLRLLATARGTVGKVQEALGLYQEAVALFRELGDRDTEGRILGSLAVLHHQMSRMEEAFQLFQQARVLQREAGNQRAEGILLGNLAIFHQDQGRLDEAGHIFEQALALNRAIGNRWSEGIGLANLGLLRYHQGRLPEARQLYEQALALHRQLGNRRSEGTTLGNLAVLCQDQGCLEEARQFFQQALTLHAQAGAVGWEGSVLDSLSQLERLAGGDLERAQELAIQGELRLGAEEYKLDLARLYCGRGHIALAAGQSGRSWLDRAEALALELNAGPDSALAKALSRLRAALATFEAGEMEQLFRGERIQDLPEGLRQRFLQTGELGEAPVSRRNPASDRPEASSAPRSKRCERTPHRC